MTDPINFTEIVNKVPSLDDLLHTSEAEKSSKPEPVEISLDEAKQYLAEAVAEKGEAYIYQEVKKPDSWETTCAYFDPDTKAPSCIVGHVLDRKGVPFERMAGGDKNLFTDVQGLVDGRILKVDNETYALLTLAQEFQDGGISWGQAVKKALENYEERAEEYDAEEYDDADNWY